MTTEHGWSVQHFASLSSTMDQAALLARSGAMERTVVASDEQTAGRGRGGRAWQSPRGQSLSCTLILRPRVPPGRLATLPMIAGVAVAEAIEEITGAETRLKWPNDVWLGDDPTQRKVAGILLSSSLSGSVVDYVLVGIGINVTTPRKELPPGAASLVSATGTLAAPAQVLDVLLRRFDAGYSDYLASNGRPSLEGWRARAALIGEPVTVEDAGRILSGVHAGIDDDGALLLKVPGGTVRRVVSGDLVRGPKAARGSPTPSRSK